MKPIDQAHEYAKKVADTTKINEQNSFWGHGYECAKEAFLAGWIARGQADADIAKKQRDSCDLADMYNEADEIEKVELAIKVLDQEKP